MRVLANGHARADDVESRVRKGSPLEGFRRAVADEASSNEMKQNKSIWQDYSRSLLMAMIICHSNQPSLQIILLFRWRNFETTTQ